MNTLVLTVGLPRSGKSTWAQSQGVPIVNPDAIRLAIHGHRFLPRAEPLVWSIAKIMVDSLFGAGHAVVILDATNLHRKLREEWYGAVDRRVVLRSFVDVSPPDCMHRAILSERGDLVDVIARMEPDWRAFRNHEHEPATFIDNVADLVAST